MQKQKFNVYTMMLFIAFVALCIGCTMLLLELKNYGNFPYWRAS